MAEVALSAIIDITEPQLHSLESVVPDAADAVNGNSFANSGVEALVVDNVGGSTRTIDWRDENGVAFSPVLQSSILANRMAVFGPFDPEIYGSTVKFLASHADLNVRVFDISRTKNIITSKKSA